MARSAGETCGGACDMTIIDKIEIVCGDVLTAKVDLLWLKYADGFRGADASVAAVLGLDFDEPPPALYLQGRGVSATEVAFAQVGPLYEFRYPEITAFGQDMIARIAEDRPDIRTVATTIHGPGYGLDEREAFMSLVKGYLSAGTPTFDRLVIVEENSQRAERLRELLAKVHKASRLVSNTGQLLLEGFEWLAPYLGTSGAAGLLGSRETGTPDEPGREKPKLFVAMPFAEAYMDEFEIAFSEAARDNGFLCERLDLESYVGDVIAEMEKRIRSASCLIALLNDHNPNVFFEVGYAMAIQKPIIFVAKEGETIPFDVRNQNRISYSRIGPLRSTLRGLIGDLKKDGTLV